MAHYFPDLEPDDQVVEPACGPGAFLGAFPFDAPAIEIELDPMLAAQAREASGRTVLVGLYCRHPRRPTAFIGNPPFDMDLIAALLGRALEAMADRTRVGLILLSYVFQTSSSVLAFARR